MDLSRIHDHGKTPEPSKIDKPKKEIYPRVLHELKMSIESASEEALKEGIPTYQAILRANRTMKNTVTRQPTKTSAGKTVMVQARVNDRPTRTLILPRVQKHTPFSPPSSASHEKPHYNKKDRHR